VTIIDSEKELNRGKFAFDDKVVSDFFLAESILPLTVVTHSISASTSRSSNYEFWFSFVDTANNLGQVKKIFVCEIHIRDKKKTTS